MIFQNFKNVLLVKVMHYDFTFLATLKILIITVRKRDFGLILQVIVSILCGDPVLMTRVTRAWQVKLNHVQKLTL